MEKQQPMPLPAQVGKQPSLSFIVPIYNVEKYLTKCVDSIRTLPFSDIEIILIDDGSTDSSGQLADQYAEQDARIRVIHQDNQGLSATRNRGMEMAQGTYLVFVDSDDWLIGDEIIRIYQDAIRTQADIAMGSLLYYYPNGQTDYPFGSIPEPLIQKTISGKKCLTELMKHHALPPMVWNYLYRREWVLKQSLRFESVVHEDELWTPVALCLAERVILTNRCFYGYRQREGSIMNTLKREKRIRDLIFITNRLLRFAAHFKFKGADKEVKSALYVRIFMLYQIAFYELSKVKNGLFQMPAHHLYSLFRIYRKLSPEIYPVCRLYYKNAQRGWKEYLKWRLSYWVKNETIQARKGKKLILIYNTMWKLPLNIPIEDIPEGYVFTTDRRYKEEADAVVFHLPSLQDELEEDLDKREGQKWILWSLECEENYPILKEKTFMDLFDFKMSYHQNAAIIYPYYESRYLTLFKEIPDNVQKTGKVCAIISSHINKSGRQEYLQELMQHIQIDSYGKLFNNRKMEKDTGKETKMELYSRYQFVIAFENSCATDYVTEKFFDPLVAGAVPIYLGAPNIDEFAPGKNCFVDTRKFNSPKALADFITACCRNIDQYQQFFEWKKAPLSPSFVAKASKQEVNPFIRICRLLR